MKGKSFLAGVLSAVMVLATMSFAVAAEETTTTDVAKIGETTYATLEAAVAAAQDNDTVELLCDAEGNGIVIETPTGEGASRKLTIDLGGHTYTVSGKLVGSGNSQTNGFQFLKGNTIKIQNGTLTNTDTTIWTTEKAQEGVEHAPAILIMNYANLTLDNVILDGTKLNGKITYLGESTPKDNWVVTLSNCNGTVNIKDTTITANEGEKTFAFDVDGSSTYYGDVHVAVVNSTINGAVKIWDNPYSKAKLISVRKAGDSPTNSTYTAAGVYKQENGILKPQGAAIVGNKCYSTFKEAFEAAIADDTVDTIDLLGKTVVLKEEKFVNDTIIIQGKKLTFKNGTFDISGMNSVANALFDCRDTDVAFEKVNFIGKNYSSAYAVILIEPVYVSNKQFVATLTDCNFGTASEKLENEGCSAAGILAGVVPANSKYVVTNCNFYLINPVRVFKTMEMEMTGCVVEATTTANATKINNAMRNVVGTIKNSTITIDGFENGLKNSDFTENGYYNGDAPILTVSDNSVIILKNSQGEKDNNDDEGIDLKLADGAQLKIDATSAVVAEKKEVNIEEEDTSGIYLIDEDGNGTKSTKKMYSLTFEPNEGEMEQKVYMVEEGETVDLSAYQATKQGYVLGGWCSDEELTQRVTSVKAEGNMTFYAKWNQPASGGTTKYTVQFNTNGGSAISARKVAKNTKLGAPTAPTREGYAFTGWYTDAACTQTYDFTQKVTKGFTLYAGWEAVVIDNSANELVLFIGQKDAKAFGETKTNDVAPKIVNNRTMLPARFVAENLGATVEWNGETRQVTIAGKHLVTGEEVVIVITIDADVATVNGEEVKLDSAAFIENDRTYTPVRFIAEDLGADVEWVGAENKVVITRK